VKYISSLGLWMWRGGRRPLLLNKEISVAALTPKKLYVFCGSEDTSAPRTRKPSKGQQVGCLRVSSLDQNEVRQLEGLALFLI
jgi:hypothetical protein